MWGILYNKNFTADKFDGINKFIGNEFEQLQLAPTGQIPWKVLVILNVRSTARRVTNFAGRKIE